MATENLWPGAGGGPSVGAGGNGGPSGASGGTPQVSPAGEASPALPGTGTVGAVVWRRPGLARRAAPADARRAPAMYVVISSICAKTFVCSDVYVMNMEMKLLEVD